MLKLNITQYTTGQSFMEINLDHPDMTDLKHLMWNYGYMGYGAYTSTKGEQEYGLVTTMPLFNEALTKEQAIITPEQLLSVLQ